MERRNGVASSAASNRSGRWARAQACRPMPNRPPSLPRAGDFLPQKGHRFRTADTEHAESASLGDGPDQASTSNIGHGRADDGIAQTPGGGKESMQHGSLLLSHVGHSVFSSLKEFLCIYCTTSMGKEAAGSCAAGSDSCALRIRTR